jgi:hypothetical protein
VPVLPFKSDGEVVEFARAFLDAHVERFQKDIAICLRPAANRTHAYFPALITCIAFADLLSGLYAGKLEGHGLKELKSYASKFMDPTTYDSLRVEILYEMFRHKVAHLAQPYVVFDTHSKRKFQSQPRRLITWTVQASGPKPTIEIVPVSPPRQVLKSATPWPVHYDHRVFIRIRGLATDIRKSVPRYLRHLKTEKVARDRFKDCMDNFFPR